MTTECSYCHKPIEPSEEDSENYLDPSTGIIRTFHSDKCHDEARKDSHKFGIDSFKTVYSTEDRNTFK
jgi:hypothetical protein